MHKPPVNPGSSAGVAPGATLSTRLVDCVFAQRARGLAPAIRRKTLLHVADNVGIAIAARETSPIAAQLRDAFGVADRVAPATYAFVASAYGHILDFDDIHDLARVHPTAVTLPAALAVAPAAGASGAELIDAVALSNELLCRLGLIWRPLGSGPGSDWFLSQLFGYFAAALAASLVLRMNAEQTRSALGLAYMQAAGGKEAGFGTGGTARAIYPAFAAMGGVQAALLARAGILGPPTALDGDAGFFRLYFGAGLDAAQIDLLLAPELSAWVDTQFKPWPCCRHSHPFVFAAQGLRAALDPATIEHVNVRVNRSAAKLCLPIAERRRPTTLQDAKYSIPFMVAFALVHDTVSLATLGADALSDARVLAMAARVHVEQTGGDEAGLPHASITARTAGAGVKDKTFEAPFAVDQSAAAIRAKFDSCMACAGLPSPQGESAWQALVGLDESGSAPVCELMGLAPLRRGA